VTDGQRRADKWAEWLAERRFGGDQRVRDRLGAELLARRDKLLDLAELAPGETLLDVGCGEGLIGFGALERGAGLVIFSDVSTNLLHVCEQAATELGVADRCRFVEASAEDLSPLADASVDVVTTRSVLIYVAEKQTALTEFARVLRPGGRISLFEPINRFAQCGGERWGPYDLAGLGDIGTKIRAVYEALQPPQTDPMLDFDERDLFRMAEEAGFFPLKLYLEAEARPIEPWRWDAFLNMAGNPNIPTLGEAMEQVLTSDERDRLTHHLRPLVEAGRGEWRMALAHLVGVKHAQ
jgi:SAM-dependent methyltransferase